MNKKQIEKRLDERCCPFDIKRLIFSEVIPEVLKSCLPKINNRSEMGLCISVTEIKQKALDLYQINLEK